MDIVAVRHGIATDARAAQARGRTDADRALTAQGERRTRAAAAGLRATLADAAIDRIVTSRLVRARQTAAILADCLAQPAIEATDALTPTAAPTALDALLGRAPNARRVLVVGHEPHLSTWVSRRLTGHNERVIRLKKAGAAQLVLPDAAGERAVLRWLLTPAQLRALA